METIPIHKAKSTLSQLVKRAAAGEIIYIGGYGKAEAALLSLANADTVDVQKRKKFLGCMKGRINIVGDFDEPLPKEILEAFGYTDEEPKIQ
jgi:antitoxin (DNA-binding transcriptional repressor) of toxin-antitoxin stability system